MDDEGGEGFGPAFYVMLLLGIIGLLGFFATAGVAVGM